MVMGGDSLAKGRGFESHHHILDGHNIFSHIFVVKINEKEAEDGPFKKNINNKTTIFSQALYALRLSSLAVRVLV